MKNRRRPRSNSRPPSSAIRLSQPGRQSAQPQTTKEPQPEPDPVLAQLARIDQISMVARTTWFGLLAFLAFVGVTLLGVEDADFFVPSRQTQLPLVNVSIPTSSFFWFAPMLGAALYAYLHLQLLKLWEALAAPKPKINGKHLSELVYPWLISDYALARRTDGALKPRPLSVLSCIVTWWLVWASAPLVLAGFWWRSMPRHDEWMTLGIAAATMLATYVGVTSNWRAAQLLRQNGRTSPRQGWTRRTYFAALCTLVIATSWLRTEGGFDHYANRAMEAWETATGKSIFEPGKFPNGDRKDARFVREEWVAANILTLQDLTHTFSPPFLDREVSISPLATTDLAGVNLVPNPENLLDHTTERRRFRKTWCQRQGMDLETCGRLYTATEPAPGHLAQRREEWCSNRKIAAPEDCTDHFIELDDEFREEWGRLWTNRTGALGRLDLSGADLRHANLLGAFLIGVNLSEARLDGANLRRARMDGAFLKGVRMEGANLWKTQMAGADLSMARMEGVNLRRARMEGANLKKARMEGARLSLARMEGAKLWEARLAGADLRDARMEGAHFFYSDLESAKLTETFTDALVRAADLRSDDITQQMLDNVFGDEETRIPEGLVMPDHWKVEPISVRRMNSSRDPKFEAWLSERQAAKTGQATTNGN